MYSVDMNMIDPLAMFDEISEVSKDTIHKVKVKIKVKVKLFAKMVPHADVVMPRLSITDRSSRFLAVEETGTT